MDGYLAEIRGFAGGFIPANWMACQGQILSVNDFTALYSLIGTYYGGDGRSTFMLPDLRGRVPVGIGTPPGSSIPFQLGFNGGYQIHTLSQAEMPTHNHNSAVTSESASLSGSITAKMKVNNDESEGKSPSGKYLSVSSGPDLYAGSPTSTDTLNNDAISVDSSGLSVNISGIEVEIASSGGSQPFSLMQPYLTINWIICVEGMYPQRS